MREAKRLIVFLGDILTIGLSFFATLIISYPRELSEQIKIHAYPFIILYLAWIIIIYVFNLYEPNNLKPGIEGAKMIGWSLFTCLVVGIIFFYFIPLYGISPKTNLLINLAIFGVLFILWRRICFRWFSKIYKRKVLIIGDNVFAKYLDNVYRSNPHLGFTSLGITKDSEEAKRRIAEENVDSVVLEEGQNIDLLKDLISQKVTIIPLGSAYQTIFQISPLELVSPSEVISLAEEKDLLIYRFFSRILEIIFSTIILIITLPITIISAIFIMLEDGAPFLYKQSRVGENGRTFLLYKFRSMTRDAEKDGAKWAEKSDSRVTRVGKILRKTHIDEIPQMWNILKGDLALVGPRPERPEFVTMLEKEVPYYFLRHTIKPGFTGWAQVKFRYARTLDDSRTKFEYDLYYMKNRNIFMDLGIIIKTAQIIFTH
ncbi:MAG: exopolysaccharide biosynthesis polyprenyl glycosylphosphotransferase [Candidatus Pacebacteria bacterium]|nr:exopolysaccharide biosynthesis polyprenyl glycosylphosphotransferase [Candidatus Paceibacterota bacterium]MBP9058031.1 exopolysaccharide biosynthesis polyprenyl glycosylphosphotransferase [Candidatus Paceibacterota bacterium]MBP9770064.1 exopolysaccharide biosynthesis polyprenyl glycosylphosphotransferase [Candidatus Paceibacterota bacterium]